MPIRRKSSSNLKKIAILVIVAVLVVLALIYFQPNVITTEIVLS